MKAPPSPAAVQLVSRLAALAIFPYGQPAAELHAIRSLLAPLPLAAYLTLALSVIVLVAPSPTTPQSPRSPLHSQLGLVPLVSARAAALCVALSILHPSRFFILQSAADLLVVVGAPGKDAPATAPASWLMLAGLACCVAVTLPFAPSTGLGLASAAYCVLATQPPSRASSLVYLASSLPLLVLFMLSGATSWSFALPPLAVALVAPVLAYEYFLARPASAHAAPLRPKTVRRAVIAQAVSLAPLCLGDYRALLPLAVFLAMTANRAQFHASSLLPLHAAAAAAATSDGKASSPRTGKRRQSILRLFHALTQTRDSKRIFYFLLLTLSFMLVELAVGLFTGSLGLVSDAGHMFFDSASLFIGLYASYAASWRKDSVYTYGYGRYETIAGFVNAMFLAFVAVLVFLESVERLFNPPEIRTGGLLLTSVLGFGINMIGVVFFHDLSSGGGGAGDHHGHSHDDTHAHSHDHGHHHHLHNDNLHGVFLHVLADTLGSVGVIVSSLLIQWKGWWVADPICSFCISVLIFASVVPLLRSTFASLMLVTPDAVAPAFEALIERARAKPEVAQIVGAHVWRQSSTTLVATVKVVVAAHVSQDKADDVASFLRLGLLRDVGCSEVAVEVVHTPV